MGAAYNYDYQLIPVGRYLNIIKIEWFNLFHIIVHTNGSAKTNNDAHSLSFANFFYSFQVQRPIPNDPFVRINM